MPKTGTRVLSSAVEVGSRASMVSNYSDVKNGAIALFMLAATVVLFSGCRSSAGRDVTDPDPRVPRICGIRMGAVLSSYRRQAARERAIAEGHGTRQEQMAGIDQFERNEIELLQKATFESFKEIIDIAKKYALSRGVQWVVRLPESGHWAEDHFMDFDVLYWPNAVDSTEDFIQFLNRESPE